MPGRTGFAILRRLDPELAHRLALAGLRWGIIGGAGSAGSDAGLACRLAGMTLDNPIGLAAGFDKDAVSLSGLARLGFGFVEVGTVTKMPQGGNPRPRLFRLREDHAVINRMGFNNLGAAAMGRRLLRRPADLPLGINIGLNKGSDAEQDYPFLAAALGRAGDYVALNVSSPNTPGLRDLQDPARLGSLLRLVRAAAGPIRLFVKLSPNLGPGRLAEVVAAAVSEGADGLIVSNTTVERPPALRSPNAGEPGGLSGAPLFGPSTAMLREVARRAGGKVALIGVGGIRSGRDILAKLEAGAHAVQLYTALALDGPELIARLKDELRAALTQGGYGSVAAAVGARLNSD